MRAASGMWRNWKVSLDGAAYLQYDDQFTQRGDQQLGITDWEMLMAMRRVSGGMLHLHVMTSVEQFVVGGGGYPELLQTGGTYLHAPIRDRQHPHDFLMELAAMYEHTVTRTLALSFYAAAVGEPALGPGGGRLSSALIWGLNVHDHGAGHDHGEPGAPPISPHHASNSVLAESNLEIGARSAVFARAERVQKDGQDLGFQGGDLTTLYDVRTLVAGFARTVATLGRVELALGARGSVEFIPSTLLLTYGTSTPAGFAVYAMVRPNGHGR